MPPTLTNFQLLVEFHPDRIPLGEDPITITSPNLIDDQLSVPQGIGMIVFTLVTIGGSSQASFPTYPIEWFEQNGNQQTPISQPEGFLVQWHNPTHCTIVDFNSAVTSHAHPFNVVAAYEGKTYGSDPTIINDPPIE